MSIEENARALFTTDIAAMGFRRLNEGWSRSAFLGPDGLVYKTLSRRETAEDINLDEICNYYRLKDSLPAGWSFPVTDYVYLEDLDESVIVQEFVDGEVMHLCSCHFELECDDDITCYNAQIDTFLVYFGYPNSLQDIAGNAVATPDGYVIFDMAE